MEAETTDEIVAGAIETPKIIEAVTDIADAIIEDANARVEQAHAVQEAVIEAAVEHEHVRRMNEIEAATFARLEIIAAGQSAIDGRLIECERKMTETLETMALLQAAQATATIQAVTELSTQTQSQPPVVVVEDPPVLEPDDQARTVRETTETENAPARQAAKRKVHLI